MDVIQKVQRHEDILSEVDNIYQKKKKKKKDIRSEVDNIYQVNVKQCRLY